MILKIYNNIEILIDNEDVERVSRILKTNCQWFYNESVKQVYGCCKTSAGKYKKFQLSRVIMNCYDIRLCVEHKNHNNLDYRKSELRVCNNQQNCSDKLKQKSCSSTYKGVYWHKRDKIWIARIKVNYKPFWLGRFNVETEAAKAYDQAAIKYFGEFAKLNFSK